MMQTTERRASIAVVAAIATFALGACSVATSNDVDRPSGTAIDSPASSSSATGTTNPPASPVKVTWGDGKNPPGMAQGNPNPAGWYEAAFGPRTTDKVLYLTYDDGPYPDTTNQILKLLAANDAKATFFVLGRQVDAFPGYVDKIIAAGHALGNHTQDHENLATHGPGTIRKQLTQVREAVGPKLGDCMRPPGGFIDDQAGAVITGMGLVPVLWTGHAQDWAPPSVSKMVDMLKKATSPGAVILLHDSIDKAKTVAASATMIPWWKKQGYRLETIPACRK